MLNMEIHDLRPTNDEEIRQIAGMLVDGFRENWPNAWPDMKWSLKSGANMPDREKNCWK